MPRSSRNEPPKALFSVPLRSRSTMVGCGLKRLWNRCKAQALAWYHFATCDFGDSTDFFFGLNFMLAISGARLGSTAGGLKRCWNLYRWLIYVPLGIVTLNTVLNVLKRARLELLLSNCQGMVGCWEAFVRIFIVLRHYDALEEVKRYVNRRHFGRNVPQSVEIRSRAFYRIRKIVIAEVAITLAAGVSILAIDVSRNHIIRLPFDLRESYPWLQILLEKCHCLLCVGIALKMIPANAIVQMILTGLTAEAEVIARCFDEAIENADKRSDSDSWKQHFQQELNECIQLHAQFLAIKNKIRPFLNASFIVTYYTTALSLASGAIYVSQMKSVSLFTLQTLYYCIWMTVDCGILAHQVTELTAAHESIGWQLYGSRMASAANFRKTVSSVLAIVQQPLRLNCYGLFTEFTKDRIYDLLNMAYSLYTVFRDML